MRNLILIAVCLVSGGCASGVTVTDIPDRYVNTGTVVPAGAYFGDQQSCEDNADIVYKRQKKQFEAEELSKPPKRGTCEMVPHDDEGETTVGDVVKGVVKVVNGAYVGLFMMICFPILFLLYI